MGLWGSVWGCGAVRLWGSAVMGSHWDSAVMGQCGVTMGQCSYGAVQLWVSVVSLWGSAVMGQCGVVMGQRSYGAVSCRYGVVQWDSVSMGRCFYGAARIWGGVVMGWCCYGVLSL